MRNPSSTVMQRALLGVVVILALVAARPEEALAVTPENWGMAGGTPVIIDGSPGNQTDPHVSFELAAYTDQSGGFSVIRFYDFFASAPGAISTPLGSADQLSDVNGNHISFARQTGLSRKCMVYDFKTWTTVQIGWDNSGAFNTALGSDTVAFVAGDDIHVGRISDPTGALINLSTSAALDSSQAVSPNGNTVVWQACVGGSCSIFKSAFNGSSWSSPVLVASAPAANTSPDTDGVLIAYDSDRAGSADGSDIYLQPLSGGADTQLSLAGAQRNPSIADGIVAFESTAVGASSADLFIYEVSTNRVFQVTDSPGFDDQLNDITVLASGAVRVVWASRPDGSPDHDIYTETFTLPPGPPGDTTAPAVTIATPADGALYTKNQAVAADYACEDEPGGSGLASCDGPVAAGAAIDTANVGGHLFAVTGTDVAGNAATLEHGYGVVFSTSPFASPVDDLPVLNSVKAGQAVPVRFSLGGDQGLAIFTAGYPKSQQIPCDSSALVDGVEETVSAGGSSLDYDASSGLYKYIWKTERSWSGTCRQLVLGLADGSSRRANFMFR